MMYKHCGKRMLRITSRVYADKTKCIMWQCRKCCTRVRQTLPTKEHSMSNTKKKEKHTLHKSKKEYSGHVKCTATGRIKQGHGSFVCPCCIHMNCNMTTVKKLSRRIIRRTFKITIEEE